MPICPNCGKELLEGEICTCTQTPAPEQAPVPESQDYTPQPEPASEPIPAPEPEPIPAPAPEPDPIPAPAPEPAQQYEYHPQPEYTPSDYLHQGYAQVPPVDNGYYAPVPPVAPIYYPEEKQPARTDYPEGYKIKKKYVAVMLGFMFGAFGIHNFYLGNKNKALAQVLISTIAGVLSVGIATAAVAIWSIVEAVLILTENIDADANGYKIQTLEEGIKDALKD